SPRGGVDPGTRLRHGTVRRVASFRLRFHAYPGAFMESAAVPRPLVKRHHGLVRLTHWLNAIVLLGMIASGLQIYGAYSHFGLRGDPLPLPNPLDGKPIPEWGRLGGWLAGGLNWHFALAWPFVVTGLLYLCFLALSGEWRA